MRRVVIDMRNFLFTDAVALALANAGSDFDVLRTESPDSTAELCRVSVPYALLMEVAGCSPWSLRERLVTGNEVKRQNPHCKIVLVVDEKSEKKTAEEVRQAKKDGLIDQFIYGLVTAEYLTALAVCALCAFAAVQDIGVEMLNFLRGPRPLNGAEISFIKNRFRGDRSYIILSYFKGATPDNDYTPTQPFTVTVSSDAHSYDEENYARLYIASGGADSPRPIKLRKKGDGQWCLWEQYLLTDIRAPKSANPWA